MRRHNLVGVMPYGLKRSDLQLLAQAKLEDAKLLLQERRFSNAYYLAGYAVEFGLKSCIARQVTPETIPNKDFLNNVFRHDFKALLSIAGLAGEIKKMQDSDSSFSANWALVAEWQPEVRYQSKDSYSAQILINAVEGVMPWIKQYW